MRCSWSQKQEAVVVWVHWVGRVGLHREEKGKCEAVSNAKEPQSLPAAPGWSAAGEIDERRAADRDRHSCGQNKTSCGPNERNATFPTSSGTPMLRADYDDSKRLSHAAKTAPPSAGHHEEQRFKNAAYEGEDDDDVRHRYCIDGGELLLWWWRDLWGEATSSRIILLRRYATSFTPVNVKPDILIVAHLARFAMPLPLSEIIVMRWSSF